MFDTKGGEGSSMLVLGGATYLGGTYLSIRLSITFGVLCVIHYYAFMCLLLCSKLYFCDSDIYVIVIYDMCALYFELFICHITCAMLICFASAFYSLLCPVERS